MKINNTFLSAWEVIKYAGMDASYPRRQLCSQLPKIIFNCFDKCFLGKDLLYAMNQDLVVKDSDNVQEYDSDKIYSIGDLVCIDGCVFESCMDDNVENPCDSDDENPSWKIPKKFNEDCYNELWEQLKFYLSFKAIHKTIRYVHHKAGGAGIMKQTGDDTGMASINNQEFLAYKKELLVDAQECLPLMYEWLKSNNLGGQFDTVEGLCKKKCEKPKVRRGRTWNWNR